MLSKADTLAADGVGVLAFAAAVKVGGTFDAGAPVGTWVEDCHH
jgi:hypothetical protein